VIVKLANCMERSAHTRQELALVSPTSITASISQHTFNHNDSLQLLPLGLSTRSSHSSKSSDLVRPRIKKSQNITKSGLTRRHSHRSLSGQDIIRRGLVKKDSLASLNGSLKSISLHRNFSWGNLSRTSTSFPKPKLSQETYRSLMESSPSLRLRAKAQLSQNVNMAISLVNRNKTSIDF
jgi:hypothetical protein